MTRYNLTHTHWHVESGTWFTPDNCETCGGEVQQANAVHVSDTLYNRRAMRRIGVTEVGELPPEGWHDDESGMEACDDCQGVAA